MKSTTKSTAEYIDEQIAKNLEIERLANRVEMLERQVDLLARYVNKLCVKLDE